MRHAFTALQVFSFGLLISLTYFISFLEQYQIWQNFVPLVEKEMRTSCCVCAFNCIGLRAHARCVMCIVWCTHNLLHTRARSRRVRETKAIINLICLHFCL